MHNFVRIAISLQNPFMQRGVGFVITCSLPRTNDEVDHPWGIYSHDEFLGVLRYIFWIFWSIIRSTTQE